MPERQGSGTFLLQPRIDLPLLSYLKQQVGRDLLVRLMLRGDVGEGNRQHVHTELDASSNARRL
ncbi:hypothetical protein ACFQ3W_03645 [Paenibacillus puldeungensis]|uniref:Uncharacterized protein n=1 Tax=Paenibacillus puldeungensis TaxID=696536 RepID=A0ABW3RSD6_9BACL